jgi:Domain of unknown function (DUF362)
VPDEHETVRSSIGDVTVDSSGTTVGVVRMDAARSYADMPPLLQRVINGGSEEAWQAIKAKIDYTYENLEHALKPLQEETGFDKLIGAELAKGKKLLLKPNLVNAMCINPDDHGEGLGYTTCTTWPFVAAVMRWFHDRLAVSYHQMAIGEAATCMASCAGRFTRLHGKLVTREAVMEGRADEFYGGWGFYFVRKYLAETHNPAHTDDPMKGYDDSVSGNYLPPGRAMDRLPVYDLNRIQDIPNSGRRVPVPGAANFETIILHKAVVGGDPSEPADLQDYPGCVLLNLPKLKVHNIALFTNAIKNLGIGLYPMEAALDPDPKSARWMYSSPQLHAPGMKSRIPHVVWTADVDDLSGLPKSVRRTAGINGTMVDIIKAVANQDVLMMSVVDAIETINIDHSISTMALRVPEGYVFGSLDVVALDVLCARYMFKMVPLSEARRLVEEKRASSEFLQRVPLPTVEGSNIVTEEGVDSPLARHALFEYAERRGIGSQQYHVVGRDICDGGRLASLQGHMGKVTDGNFSELITSTLYFDHSKLLWDLQATVMAYAAANDALTGSDYRQEFLDAFDENGDGVIDYDETGKKGVVDSQVYAGGYMVHLMGTDPYGVLRGSFVGRANGLKWANPDLNGDGHDFVKEYMDSSVALVGLTLSQMEMEGADPFFPTMTWGKGKWPSLQAARFIATGSMIYGLGYPLTTTIASLYGLAFQYADKAFGGGKYTGSTELMVDPTSPALSDYLQKVAAGGDLLPFVFYVPAGFGQLLGKPMPNIQETQDPNKVLTAAFNGGTEVW